ncbi:MAG: DUF6677 family protein [Acidobacteriota bacterium]|nr:DUF6677 family protein [Acidobacteriota bacterium]
MDSSRTEVSRVGEMASSPRLAVALALGWLIPGAGHLVLGKRKRAAAFFLIILATLVAGTMLDGELYRTVGAPLATLATLAAAGVGAPYFVLLHLLGYTGSLESAGYEYGKAFILTAGLMNILLLLDVFDIGRGRKT